MLRLNETSLATVAPGTIRPDYDRANVTPGIVHLGIGAFHRAHLAAYVDSALSLDPSWGIIGASLRRPDTKAALAPQDHLYSLTTRDAGGSRSRIVGSILDIMDGGADIGALIEQMAQPGIRIVSLTVTEKGYCHDPAGGHLQLAHPDIVHDLANIATPRSAPGVIVAALARRRERGHKGFTVLSCDNLPGNGRVAARVVTELAQQIDPALARWIGAHVRFPSTMVDRIVPATTEQDRQDIAALIGVQDAWPVVTEPFSQFVVENNFVAGHPPWENAGVQMAPDVEPYEQMKLRLLNGSHSTMAYLGLLAGHSYVAEAVADPAIRALLRTLMTDEMIPTLHMPDVDLNAYVERLLARFANPALQHRCSQIAMDGSQKLPQRILMPIRERLAKGQSIQCLSLTIAAWIAFISEAVGRGHLPIHDPLAAKLTAAAIGGDHSAERLVAGFVGIAEIFGSDLPARSEFCQAVTGHLVRILDHGVQAAVTAAEAVTTP